MDVDPDKFKGKFSNTDDSERQAKVAVNSIDYVTHVERLSVSRSNAGGVYLYGLDNNYPYKLQQLALRSNSLVTAMNTYSKFLRGLGFEGATPDDVKNGTAVVINSQGQTAFDLLKFVTQQKANINFCIHVNYNQLGEAVEFTPIPYEFVRQKVRVKDDKFDMFIITNIWHLEQEYRNSFRGYFSIENFQKWANEKKLGNNFTSLEVFDYNPDAAIVREQIEQSGGIENYSGQLFYAKDTTEIYQKAIYDSVIDDGQTEAEAKLFSLSNLQNGFAASGVFKYPGNISSMEESKDLKKKIGNVTGSVNQGRLITVPYSPGQPPTIPFFESIQQNNVDNMFVNQRQDSKRNIYELFQQPGIINGRSDDGMFNQASMQDAFDFYNAVTEPARQQLEIELTTLFQNSVFKDQVKLPIEIEPLIFGTKKTTENDIDN